MMYGKTAKPAAKTASKKKAMPLTIMVAIGKPKMSLPVRGQRTATNMMKKTGRGK
jgi:ribosomal protein S13